MAREFIHDSVGLTESTLTDGTASGSTFSASSSVTNEERAIDMSISTAFTSFNADDTLRFDLGSAQTANCIALYYSSAHGHDFKLYRGSSATAMGTEILNQTASISQGWNVITFTETSGRYWFLRSTTGTIDDITEIIIGNRYEFDVNPEINATIGEEFGTDVVTSYGGNEYANKRHEPKTTFSFSFSHILSTQKTAFENLNADVQDFKKFLYKDDDNNYHYVRLTQPIDFTEVAPNVFSANINLREQLS